MQHNPSYRHAGIEHHTLSIMVAMFVFVILCQDNKDDFLYACFI